MATVRIAFLGQCLIHGYPGVPPDATYPEIVRAHLEREHAGLQVEVVAQPCYHPVELGQSVASILDRVHPHLVVVDVAAWSLVQGATAVDLSRLPRGARTAYERMRHFRAATYGVLGRWPLGGRLVRVAETTAHALADGVLGGILHRYPRPSLAEYEDLLADAVLQVKANPGVALVLQGPSTFNPDESHAGCVGDSLEVYRAVNAMTARVAAAHDAMFVDRLALYNPSDRSIFLPGSIRPSPRGHALLGHTVADTLLRAGLV